MKIFNLLNDKEFYCLLLRILKGIFLFPLMFIITVLHLIVLIIDTDYYVSFVERLYKNVHSLKGFIKMFKKN